MDENPKLGEVTQVGGTDWICTAVYPPGSIPLGSTVRVWTPIPAGETAQGLGRTYKAAECVYSNPEPIERLAVWPEEAKE